MKKLIISVLLSFLLLYPASVQAVIVTLSLYSSDDTPADNLDATVEFSVTGTTLTIEVTNLTDGPDSGYDNGYDIMSLYFNATSNVTGLTLTTPTSGWALSTNETADGFGQFDFALIDGTGNDPDQIEGETSKTFTLNVAGSGISASNFCTDLSITPPGNPMLIAAKFVSGPEDDSGFGAVPEPTTIALLGFGALSLIRKRWA